MDSVGPRQSAGTAAPEFAAQNDKPAVEERTGKLGERVVVWKVGATPSVEIPEPEGTKSMVLRERAISRVPAEANRLRPPPMTTAAAA